MWDLLASSPLGRLSKRNFFTAVTALLVALFSTLTILSQPTAAATDAKWNDDGTQISYNSTTFSENPDGTQAPSVKAPNDAAAVYYYKNPQASQTQVIYFPKGSDPTSATSAKYYVFTPPNKVEQQRTISINKKPQSTSSEESGSSGKSACAVEGIGWIVCPISNALAKGMDYLFKVLTQFLEVAPLSGSQSNVIYKAWSYMRNVANLALIIGFLIIIYSQVTSFGISNYGIKKLLPRLVIAAVLMNLSYWICAIAIDLSNILAVSFQSLFTGLHDSIVKGGGNVTVPSWQGLTAAVLAGGGVAVGLGATILAPAAIGGALVLLLPTLVGVALSAFIAVVVLAARQALIVVLTMVAPLAFVAYLLPNTEKYFHKWRETFTTMMLVFPIFAFLFGGAQVAGAAIIQTAGNIVVLILGMAVQVVPLAITPFLLKFSGGLLSQVAGIVNNPNKGIVDRTRNWSQSTQKRQMTRARANGDRFALWWDQRGRARDEKMKNYEMAADNRWHASRKYSSIHTNRHDLETAAKQIETEHELHLKARLDPQGSHFDERALQQHLRLSATQDQVKAAEGVFEAIEAEARGGNLPNHLRAPGATVSREWQDVIDTSSDASRNVALAGMRKQMAEAHEKRELTDALLENTATIGGETLREYAGGVMGETGAEAVLANAVTQSRKQYQENVDNKKQLIKHFNLSGAQRQNLAMGNTGNIVATKDGVSYEFKTDDDFSREAAIEMQMGGMGNVQNIEAIVAESGNSLDKYKTTISQMIVDGRVSDKVAYLSGKSIDDVAQGKIENPSDLTALATRAIAQGKVKPSQLVNMDYDALKRVQTAVTDPNMKFTTNPEDIAALEARRDAIYRGAYEALKNGNLRGNIAGNSFTVIEELASHDPRSRS